MGAEAAPRCRLISSALICLARVANPEEAISSEELQLAARNHGMPLESLRWDITPPGLHYLLIHYDIPAIDPAPFELVIDGLVDTPLSLDLDALAAGPGAQLSLRSNALEMVGPSCCHGRSANPG